MKIIYVTFEFFMVIEARLFIECDQQIKLDLKAIYLLCWNSVLKFIIYSNHVCSLSLPFILQAVMEFLDCNQPDRHAQFVPLLLRMMKFDEFQKKKVEDALPSTTLHGSLILQEFLQFNKPSKVCIVCHCYLVEGCQTWKFLHLFEKSPFSYLLLMCRVVRIIILVLHFFRLWRAC